MIRKDFPWINVFFKCYFSWLSLRVCYRLKIQMCMSVQAGHMQLPENLGIIKWYYFKTLSILLHLLRKARWWKLHPESSALLLSVIMLHGLGKTLSTREVPAVLLLMAHGFHHTNSELRESACNKDCQAALRLPRGMGAQRSGVSFTPTKPWVCQLKSILLIFWANTLAVLPFKRWKTNLSYQPAVLIFLNSAGVLKFAVICWNIPCYKALHTVDSATTFFEEI